jgi:large subunit ribosomal protein L18
MKCVTKKEFRKRRHMHLRKQVQGTAERPRMSVFVSNRHMYVQFIDDLSARTMASASTLVESSGAAGKNTVEIARKLGALAAETAKKQGIGAVVFDRGGFAYRGRVKALAEAAREAGLQF